MIFGDIAYQNPYKSLSNPQILNAGSRMSEADNSGTKTVV